MMETRVKKWGNSQGVRLPKKMLSKIGISDPVNQLISIKVEDNRIIISREEMESKLEKRFAGFDLKSYKSSLAPEKELDWGADVGAERFE